jgi:hypothetical protein
MAKVKSDDLDIEIKANFKDADKWRAWMKSKKNKSGGNNSGEGMLYCVGFVGSFVYWMQAAVGFGAVVTGILKSLVWPAYLVYKLLENFYGVVN